MREEPIAFHGGFLRFRNLQIHLFPGWASEEFVGECLVLRIGVGLEVKSVSAFEHVPRLVRICDPAVDHLENEHDYQSGRTLKRGLMMSSVKLMAS